MAARLRLDDAPEAVPAVPEPANDPAAQGAVVTFFPDIKGKRAVERALSLRDLAERIATATATSREALPALCLATFGDIRSDRGSLRTAANLIASTGVALDHDAGTIPLAIAADRLRAVGVAALLYSTSRSTPEHPRWRALLPASGPLSVGEHARLVTAAAALIGPREAFDERCWFAEQGWFFGALDGQPQPEIVVFDGVPLDLLPAFADAPPGATTPPRTEPGSRPVWDRAPARPYDILDRAEIEAALRASPNGTTHANLVRLAASLAAEAAQDPAGTAARLARSHLLDLISHRTDPDAAEHRRSIEDEGPSGLVTSAFSKYGPADEAPDPFTADAPATPKTRRDYRGFTPSEMAQAPAPSFWDADRTMPRQPEGNLILAAGRYSSHKTNLALSRCLDAIAEHGAIVLWCAGEAAAELGRDRIPAQCQVRDIPVENLDASLRIVAACPLLCDPAEIAGFIAAHADFHPDIVVLDTLAIAMAGADENSTRDAGLAMDGAGRIRDAWGCSVVLIHHLGKDPTKGARGSSVLLASADAAWELSFDREAGIVEQRVEKMRCASADRVARFGTRIVDIGRGDGDAGVMTVVPLDPDQAPRRAADTTQAFLDEQQITAALRRAGAGTAATSLATRELARLLAPDPTTCPESVWQIAFAKAEDRLENGARERRGKPAPMAAFGARLAWPLDAPKARVGWRWFLHPAEEGGGE